jgi:hypothetical protein
VSGVPAAWLRRFYGHEGNYFMLVRPGALVFTENSSTQKKFGASDPKESLLRLFMRAGEAEHYRNLVELDDARVMKTTLVGVWNIKERINSLSMRQHKLPVRIEVCVIDGAGDPRPVDTLSSIYELLS